MELSVALNEPPSDDERAATYRLDLSTDETARQKQLAALERARSAARDRLAELRRVLLGETAPTFKLETPLVPFDASLNPSQQDAIRFALSANDLAILHGPPGTGKTTAVVELIRQACVAVKKCSPARRATLPGETGLNAFLEQLGGPGVCRRVLDHQIGVCSRSRGTAPDGEPYGRSPSRQGDAQHVVHRQGCLGAQASTF